MRHFLAFFILAMVKTFSQLLFRAELKWITPKPDNEWSNTRIISLMNHTSLYEPLYLRAFSYSYLWYLTSNLSVPGADITLKRPIVGLFWKLMLPNIASVSRKKDATWDKYLESIKEDSVVMIAPEGRMKRPNGLDKNGRPMTIKGGIADIIETIDDGAMVLCFSGGLHHVQSPGQLLPTPFKTIKLNLAYIDLKKYKASFTGSPRERKLKMVQDLQARLERDCPTV